MNLSDRLKINAPKVVYETIDDETILLNLDRGVYYSLDDMGAVVWEFIEQNYPLGEIIKNIEKHYTDSPEEIEASIKQFLSELQEDGLVVIAEEGQNQETKTPPDKILEKLGGDNSDFSSPKFQKYTDMQDLLLLDPIHDADDTGWPSIKTD